MIRKALLACALVAALVVPTASPAGAVTADRFQPEKWATFTPPEGWETQVICDCNKDGFDDVANFSEQNGTWWVAVSNGGTAFNVSRWADFSTPSGWTSQIVGDFDEDGHVSDIANFHGSNGTWWVSISDGNKFTTTLWADFNTTTGWKTHLVGDFDGDGYFDDIASFHSTNATWWVSISDGTKFTTTLWDDFAADSGWGTQIIGDFNRDGFTDIANFFPSAGHWWVSISQGDRFITTLWTDYTTTSGWTSQILGDFNNDGYFDDIANYNEGNGTWWVSLSNGIDEFLPAELWAAFQTPTGWQTQIPGDYDGDGYFDDIANYNDVNGTWWVSISDGSTFVATNLWAAFSPPNGWVTQLTGFPPLHGTFDGNPASDIANFSILNGTWWVNIATT